MVENFLESSIKLAKYYKSLGEKTFAQLSDDELHWSPGSESNNIITIVKHLSGNMLSRWTNFLTEDGEKPWRQREDEFDDNIETKVEMTARWNEGWDCFIAALKALKPEQLNDTIYIRNEGHTIMEAIQRQIAHYPYHVGQIVFIGKIIKGQDWNSLSIPKGGTEQFNKDKFDQEKSDRHFTDQV